MTQPDTSTVEIRWKPPLPKLPRFICKHGQRGWHFSLSARWRRQNTAYVNDRSNWVCLCNSCDDENEAYWKDMWDEYRSGCL